jgi:hypothetical protein
MLEGEEDWVGDQPTDLGHQDASADWRGRRASGWTRRWAEKTNIIASDERRVSGDHFSQEARYTSVQGWKVVLPAATGGETLAGGLLALFKVSGLRAA